MLIVLPLTIEKHLVRTSRPILCSLSRDTKRLTARHFAVTHFQPMFHFYIPRKHQKTSGFLMFSGGIEVEHWLKMG